MEVNKFYSLFFCCVEENPRDIKNFILLSFQQGFPFRHCEREEKNFLIEMAHDFPLYSHFS